MIIGFANSIDPDETAHNELSHLGLCYLTFSFSTLHINFFTMDSLFRRKADDECRLKFGSERINKKSDDDDNDEYVQTAGRSFHLA